MPHQYNTDFMNYTNNTSRQAAKTIVPILQGWFSLGSILDVGCARGTWLSVWADANVSDIHGVDGEYVERANMSIPSGCFTATDLSQSFDLSRRFDLVQSLEVAEHIPETRADIFIDNLVKHASKFILFSAAPPGQGGEFHVNEQPYEYWQEKLAARGYVACDCLRPRIIGNQQVSFWYRYNLLLYVRQDSLASVAEDIRTAVVPMGSPIRDVSPTLFRLRKAVVRCLPSATKEWLARTKARHSSR